MIDKIQKYLLENFPLIWNIRLFPITLIIIVANLIFFGLGYAITDTAFKGYNYYRSIYDDMWILYFASIVIAIIIFVAWLVLYFRNNALKVYYPRKTGHVFAEWLLCFILCAGIAFIPCSLSSGSISKWRATTSIKEATEALRIIYKAEILIPSNVYSYTYDAEGSDKPIPVPEDMKKNIKTDSTNLSRYSFVYDKNNIAIKGYIGPSLLFYKIDHYYYYLENSDDQLSQNNIKKEIDEVKLWLQSADTAKIKALMTDYMGLIKKHKLETTINVDNWFKRIYNPPYFSVDTSTVIMGSVGNSSLYWGDKYYSVNHYGHSQSEVIYAPEIENNSLSNGYEQIIRQTRYNEDFRITVLVALCFALGLSFFVFSCRITGGKKWLKTLLFIGIFALCMSLFTALTAWSSYSGGHIYSMAFVSSWLLLFAIIVCLLMAKVAGRKEKTSTNVAMTAFLWFIPAILPLLYTFIIILFDYNGRYDFDTYFNVETMFWVNIPVSIIAMIPISLLIRKWKSLAEE